MKSQTGKLIDHFLRKKSITWVEAADLYRVRSLTRRIADIRAKGMPIISEWRRDLNGQRYVRYRLDVPEWQKISGFADVNG